jgi:hypothetical protein
LDSLHAPLRRFRDTLNQAEPGFGSPPTDAELREMAEIILEVAEVNSSSEESEQESN